MKNSEMALWEIYRLTERIEDAYQGDFNHRMQGDAPLPEEDNPKQTRATWVGGALVPYRRN